MPAKGAKAERLHRRGLVACRKSPCVTLARLSTLHQRPSVAVTTDKPISAKARSKSRGATVPRVYHRSGTRVHHAARRHGGSMAPRSNRRDHRTKPSEGDFRRSGEPTCSTLNGTNLACWRIDGALEDAIGQSHRAFRPHSQRLPFQPTINFGTSNRNGFISRSLKRDLCGVTALGIRNHHGPLIAAGACKNEKLNTLVVME